MPTSTGSTTLTTSSLSVNKTLYRVKRLALSERSKPKGFTLIELLIVISIIGILSAIGIVSYSTILKNSRDAKRQADIKGFQSALEQYRADNTFYPSSLNLNATTTFDSSSGNPTPPGSVKVYINNTPTEPSLNSTYPYFYSALPASCNNTTIKCTSYCLYAKLENSVSQISKCTDKPGYTLEVTVP